MRGGLPCLRARLGRARLLLCLRRDGGNEAYQVAGGGAVRVPSFVAEEAEAEPGPAAWLYALCLALLRRHGDARALGPVCVAGGGAYYLLAGFIHPGLVSVPAQEARPGPVATIRGLAGHLEPILPGRGAPFARDGGRVLALLGAGLDPLRGSTWCAYAGFLVEAGGTGPWEEHVARIYEVRAYGARPAPRDCAGILEDVLGRWSP